MAHVGVSVGPVGLVQNQKKLKEKKRCAVFQVDDS